MTKGLIIGIATVAISGTALLGTGMYAATTAQNQGTGWFQGGFSMRGPESLINTLSGKVSPEALKEFQTLVNAQRTEITKIQTNASGGIDRVAIEKLRTEHQAAVNALMVKYPELKSALPVFASGGKTKHGMMGQRQNPINTILSGVSDSDRAAIENIRNEYQTKHDTLHTEERTKIEAILEKYPELKTQFNNTNPNGPMRGGRGMGRGMNTYN